MELDVIYNQDCLAGLKAMPDKSVDLILTDPPYGIKYQSNFRTKTEKFDVLANDDNDLRFLSYPELFRVLKENACCIVFASWKNVAKDFQELERLFTIRNMIIWFKRGGGLGDLKHSLLTDYEIAIVCHKGKCPIRGKRDGSVWEVTKMNPNKMLHPTQKPDELIDRLILKFSDPDDIVCDPFLGSGTTAVSAVKTNRRYIGFEIDPDYFQIACERLDEAEGGGIRIWIISSFSSTSRPPLTKRSSSTGLRTILIWGLARPLWVLKKW